MATTRTMLAINCPVCDTTIYLLGVLNTKVTCPFKSCQSNRYGHQTLRLALDEESVIHVAMDSDLRADLTEAEPTEEEETVVDITEDPIKDPEVTEHDPPEFSIKGESEGWLFESSRDPEKTYEVTAEEYLDEQYLYCTCPGFRYRTTCKHVKEINEKYPRYKLHKPRDQDFPEIDTPGPVGI